jgi:hypothetical protein
MLRALACLSSVLFAGCAAPTPTEPRARVPFLAAHGLVFVELGWTQPAPLLALVDTGASASAIDDVRAAGLPSLGRADVVGTTGTLQADMVPLSGLRLGERPLPPLRATRRPLAGLLAPAGRQVDMILGSDAFAAHAVTLDFTAGLLELAPSSGGLGGVPMGLDNGIPHLAARLGAVAVELRLDTGASLFDTEDVYVNIPTRVWEALRARDPGLAPSTHFRGTGADGGSVDLKVAPVAPITIGPAALARGFVIVQPEAGYFADPRAKGFVGNNFLRKLGRVTLDYGAGRFHAGA